MHDRIALLFRFSQDWAGTPIQLSSRNSFAVSVKDNIPLVFNEHALGEIAIQGSEGVGSVITVSISKNLLDFLGHIWGVIERNLREEMMRDVVMRDVVQEVTTHPTKEGAINCCCSATKEGPSPLAEMRKDRVVVLQVNQGNDPVVGQEIWNYVNHGEMLE